MADPLTAKPNSATAAMLTAGRQGIAGTASSRRDGRAHENRRHQAGIRTVAVMLEWVHVVGALVDLIVWWVLSPRRPQYIQFRAR